MKKKKKKSKYNKALARMWRNWKFWTLLLRMQSGAATMENSMEVPQKLKNRTT